MKRKFFGVLILLAISIIFVACYNETSSSSSMLSESSNDLTEYSDTSQPKIMLLSDEIRTFNEGKQKYTLWIDSKKPFDVYLPYKADEYFDDDTFYLKSLLDDYGWTYDDSLSFMYRDQNEYSIRISLEFFVFEDSIQEDVSVLKYEFVTKDDPDIFYYDFLDYAHAPTNNTVIMFDPDNSDNIKYSVNNFDGINLSRDKCVFLEYILMTASEIPEYNPLSYIADLSEYYFVQDEDDSHDVYYFKSI